MRLDALLTIAISCVGALPAFAQSPPKNPPERLTFVEDPAKPGRYVHFPIPGDAESLVRQQLESADMLRLKDKLFRELRDLKIDPDQVKGLKLDDPVLQKQIKEWISKNPPGTKPSPEELKKLGTQLQELVESKPSAEMPGPDPPFSNPETMAPASALTPPANGDEPFRDWMKEFMERAEESKLGDWLKDSPAWRKAFTSLHAPTSAPQHMPSLGGLDKLGSKLFAPANLPLPDAKLWERLGALKPPNLPRWNVSLPHFSRPTLPGAPRMPPLPTASALGTVAIWILCGTLILALGWQASRWLAFSGRASATPGGTLGPWPVDPRSIVTRHDLVKAFDYLALLLFGTPARSWHHHAIARAFAKKSAVAHSAISELAALYEQARYAPGAGAMVPEERDRARRALAAVAEVRSR